MTVLATEKETRVAPLVLDSEARSGGKLKLRGHAAVWLSEADIGGFTETLRPGAFKRALREHPDCFLLWQHRMDSPLARTSAGNLRVTEDERGLAFEAELPDTSLARDCLELVRSGVTSGMSFAFNIAEGGDDWSTRSDGSRHRTIHEVERLWELSIVSQPAYDATDVSEGRTLEEAVAEMRAKAKPNRRGRMPKRDQSPYKPDGQFSWVRDRAVVAAQENVPLEAMRLSSLFQALSPDTRVHGDASEARARLAKHGELERRDLTTGATAGGGFTPTSGPSWLGEIFGQSVRDAAKMPALLPVEELPPKGTDIRLPRVTSGPSAAVQAAEGDAVSDTDIVETAIVAPVVTLAGQQDVSTQLLDRSEPGIDAVLFTELARALAETLDDQVLEGSGASGQLEGLTNVTGITTASYTDGSPTPGAFWAALQSANADHVAAYGELADSVIMHPRRLAWLYSWRDTAGAGQVNIDWGSFDRVVGSSSIVTNAGGGTNQDEVLLLSRAELPLYLGGVIVEVMAEVLSGTLGVRLRARQYAALPPRQPGAITHLTGTGLTSPVFS